MSIKTSDKIVAYISKHGQVSGKELSEYLHDITPRAVRKQLKNLFEKGTIQKIGKPPKVYYSLALPKKQSLPSKDIDAKSLKTINARYLYISPTGEEILGWDGFVAWCMKTGQDPAKTAKEYITTLKKYDAFRTGSIVNGMKKMNKTFAHVYINMLFYLDFYSIERFGKTKLGQILLYAKQSQNKKLIRQLVKEIKPQIETLIKKYKIDALLFVPPTVKREVQFMKEFEKYLHITLPVINIVKVKTPIIIPQKTLTKLEDRVENARNTIVVDDIKTYTNILIIDDAVGSGATINETAKQVKKRGLANGKIIGLAITGSFKGFDVISEV